MDSLERLIQIKEQFDLEEVTPLCVKYNTYIEKFNSLGYGYNESEGMAILSIKKELTYNRLNDYIENKYKNE